jgi:mono/diheme cytochrome c family protein
VLDAAERPRRQGRTIVRTEDPDALPIRPLGELTQGSPDCPVSFVVFPNNSDFGDWQRACIFLSEFNTPEFHSRGVQRKLKEVCMLKAVTMVLVIWAMQAGGLQAQEIKKVPVQPTSAASGQQMFGEYCAVCHGKDAKGGGPAADALKKRPADLTQLSRKNGGKFPELQVMNFITGDEVVAAHGSRDMPVWGQLFRSLSPNNQEMVRLRAANLMEYVKSLQAR